MHLAVIDLGSNTFHLLIANCNKDGIESIVYKKRIFVGLSEGGIDSISLEKIQLGLDAITDFKRKLLEFDVLRTRILGTAILRQASNKNDFILPTEDIMGQNLEIINGQKEADLIYKGICLNPKSSLGTHLVMDIGGGSTEFIIIKNGEKIWSQSYNIGVGVLYARFQKTDPISSEDKMRIKKYIIETCEDLWIAIDANPCEFVTGASGSFEVLQNIEQSPLDLLDLSPFTLDAFDRVYDTIINTSYDARLQMKRLPKERAKLIVVGMILMQTVIEKVQPNALFISQFALKEGALSEMITAAFTDSH
ncbi:MAG: hypothetical protein R2774_08060 [Saprospiraceae bacterium]